MGKTWGMVAVALGLLLALLVGLLAWGQWRWSAKTQALLQALNAAAERERRPAPFDLRELDGLPEPVARHLRLVLPQGSTLIRAVEVTHEGEFNLSENGSRWRPFRSQQRVVLRRPGFVWDGRVSMAPGLAVHVHDAYVAGEGLLEPAIAGLFSLVQLRDREATARGELMRFLAEATWYPTALLPREGLQWEPIDAQHARATLVDGELHLSLRVHFGTDGLIDRVHAEQRDRLVGGRSVPTPWEGRFSDYQRRDGLLVPLQGEVAWLTPQGRLPYWRGRIVALRYER
ncbi:MAG: hypothetical protein J0L58_18715 [Burkholderiales bacterium]|nr:hypothetical protein [Burkholderiales bacterium]